MLGKFATEAKVGVFVVITVVALVWLSVRINRHGFSLSESKTIYVVMDQASGVMKRTPVEFAGIRVGFVEGVDLISGKARLTLKVDPRIPIYYDSFITLANRGILGEKIIAISGGGREPEIPDGGTVETKGGSGGIDEAFRNFNELASAIKDLVKGGQGKPSLNDIIANVTDISEDLRQLVRGNKKELSDIVQNVNGFTKMLNDGDIKQIVVNLKTSSETLKEFVKDANPELRDVVKDFKTVMAKIDDTVSSLNRVVAKVERGEGTIGKLLSDETTVNKVNETLDGVNDFVSRVKRLEIAVGVHGEYLSSSRQVQEVASFKISPNYDKYFLFEFTNGPLADAKTVTSVTTTIPPGTSTTETVRNDKFSFTALFAQRFYDLTVKAGIIRSSGGFGAEYFLFRDHLSLGADVFDFSRPENLHMRGYAMLHLFKILHISGGVDDIFNGNKRRNYFAGAGIMLTDNDLKAMVGLAPLISR
jgi:phospholipid/cholesterol/gamma-HCH transport system substrate-binding protein